MRKLWLTVSTVVVVACGGGGEIGSATGGGDNTITIQPVVPGTGASSVQPGATVQGGNPEVPIETIGPSISTY